MISFVIPVFNERQTLEALVEGILTHCPAPCELVFVDDGSTDGSYEELHRLASLKSEVRLLRMRGNFGKATALAAGFAQARGEIVLTLDSDMQDDPKEIPRFLDALESGLDVVCGWRQTRHDPLHKTGPSWIYNTLVARLFGVPLHDVNCGFRAIRRGVVDQVPLYGGLHRLLPMLAHQLNYRVGEIPVDHHARRYGASKYGWQRYFAGLADVINVYALTRFRHRPGHLLTPLGLAQWALAILLYFSGAGVSGSVFFVGGLLCLALGAVAEMILHQFMRLDPAVYVAEEDPG